MFENQEQSVWDKLTPQQRFVAESVLANLKDGLPPWEQGWITQDAPISAITGKRYNGMNFLALMLYAKERGYTDNRWLTFNQMKEKGWRFKTNGVGESLGKKAGMSIEYYELRDRQTKKPYDESVTDGMTADEKWQYEKDNVYSWRKYYTVFNGDIIDGIPQREVREIDSDEINERMENFLQGWSENESPIVYGGDKAYYVPDTDKTHLPTRHSFKSMQGFYGTALHEVGHSTGHPSRLNRVLSTDKSSSEYAEEELCAEFVSVFLCAEFGVRQDAEHLQNNSAYIKSWYRQIQDDPNILMAAIADANKIAKYVMGKEKEFAEQKQGENEMEQQEENKSEVFIRPSEVAASAVVARAVSVDMTARGESSLTRMGDREVVAKAGSTYSGEKFKKLYNGGSIFGRADSDARALMTRLAVFTGQDKEQLIRVFQSSGQCREDIPLETYEKMADEAMALVAEKRGSAPLQAVAAANHNRRAGVNAKA